MAQPVTYVEATDQQHLLFLFVPLKKGTVPHATKTVAELHAVSKTAHTHAAQTDPRPATGVHYFMIYPVANADKLTQIPVTSFQAMKDKDLLAVFSVYDNDFGPYIQSFVNIPAIEGGLNLLLSYMDESGIPGGGENDPTSAKFILKNGGVKANANAFYCMLMRYNLGSPTQPASSGPIAGARYTFGTNFPGLTVGKILDNYPDARTLWPLGGVNPPIGFQESTPPVC